MPSEFSPDPDLAARAAYLFDLDGTLVDSGPKHEQAFRRALAECAPDLVPTFDYRKVRGLETTHALEVIGVADAEERTRIAERKRIFYREMVARGEVLAYPAAKELLGLLKERGKKIVVVTSASRASATMALTHAGLGELAHAMVTGDDVKHGKPHPALYLRAKTQFGLVPRATLTIEDAPAGVESSIAAGIDVVLLHTRVSTQRPGLLASFADFAELGRALVGAVP